MDEEEVKTSRGTKSLVPKKPFLVEFYLRNLQENPVATKAITRCELCACILWSWYILLQQHYAHNYHKLHM